MKLKYIGSLYLLCVLVYLLFFLPMYSTYGVLPGSMEFLPVLEKGRASFFDRYDLYFREHPPAPDEAKNSVLDQYYPTKKRQTSNVEELLEQYREAKSRFYRYRFDTIVVEIGTITVAFGVVALALGKK